MFEKRKITAALLATAMTATPTAFVMAQESAVQPKAEAEAGVEVDTAETGAAAETEAETGAETTMQADAPEAPETPVFEDAQIEAFASAVIDVTEIRDRYAAQLQELEDEGEQQALIEEANAEMRTAIEETEGLTFEDYMAINRAASMDQDLNQKIAQRLEEMQGDQAG
ncbi:DUF4168 domain-containing protein [Roseivivax sp. CAU 1761]